MPSTLEIPDIPARLQAFDPDLPMLAAQAAMELDNYQCTGEKGFSAVKELHSQLQNSFAHTGGANPSCKNLLDSSAVSLLGHALHATSWVKDIATVDQLSGELWGIAQWLGRVETEADQLPIEKIRDFCVALSECAASQRQAFHDLRPFHPCRG
jgi:hypothetical protein